MVQPKIVLTHHELERQQACQYSIPERCNRRADTAVAGTGYQFITLKRCHRRASMANTRGAPGLPAQHITLVAKGARVQYTLYCRFYRHTDSLCTWDATGVQVQYTGNSEETRVKWYSKIPDRFMHFWRGNGIQRPKGQISVFSSTCILRIYIFVKKWQKHISNLKECFIKSAQEKCFTQNTNFSWGFWIFFRKKGFQHYIFWVKWIFF